MEAGTLNCPECGAVVEKDAPQCQYCHALLQTVACPHCMGMMFAGTKFCPHCGVRVETILQGKDSERHCPRCQVKLEDVQVANTPLEECTRCGGLWIDVAGFEFICANTEAQNAATGMNLPPPVASDPHVHYLSCPTCGNLMSRTNYANRSGVIINVCRQHGIWLDRDEMRQVIEFVRAGGLDRARRIEKEELAEARRAVMFQPDEGTALGGALFRNSVAPDDRAHLIRGLASLANHFLGDS
jgi:Zn-finger nucleic acid-binding protein